jgi:serine/threonine protein kinase
MELQTSPASCVIAVKKFKRDRDQADRTSHWENEVRVLEKMKCLGHDHIVRFLTAFRHGEGEGQSLDHYICFEWASGGNLADLWDEDPQPRLSGPLIRSVVQQLRGLAQALNAIHYFRGPDGETTEASFIHGDIKPKNILWFRDGGEIGTLKLADWGEATVYGADGDKANTATRHNTTGKLGTRRYEPPEVETGLNIDDSGITKIGRSRLYDTWSFGCFSLEFIIWLLHGTEGLKKFRHDSVGDYGLADSFYEINHERRAKVHGVVTYWIDHLEKDALCKYESSALGDLLDIVRNGLLVVKLPQGGGGSRTQVKTYPRFILQGQDKSEDERTKHISHETVTVEYVSVADGMPTIVITNAPSSLVHQNDAPLSVAALERFRAVELVENLDRVCQKNQSDQYWFQAAPRCPMPPKYRNRTSLVKIPRQVRGNYDCPDLDPEDWQFRLDNEFAVKIFEQLVASDVLPPASPAHVTDHLCDKCRDFQGDVWSPFFSMTYETELLYQNTASRSCDLCALLSRVCQDNASATHSSVGFERRNSTIRMTNVRLPVLSLFCDYSKLLSKVDRIRRL